MAILELFFILFKTLILSMAYAVCLLLLILLVYAFFKNTLREGILHHTLKFWAICVFFFWCGLLTYKFSYWRDTGLGDNIIIPVGYDQHIQSEEFQWTYFFPDPHKTNNGDEIIITNYAVVDYKLCAAVDHQFSKSPTYDYIVYDIKNHSLRTFDTGVTYTEFASCYKLPLPDAFYSFEQHYYEFTDKRSEWEWWLLP
jgi:hypothetical protein